MNPNTQNNPDADPNAFVDYMSYFPQMSGSDVNPMPSSEGLIHKLMRGSIITAFSGIKGWKNPHVPPPMPQNVAAHVPFDLFHSLGVSPQMGPAYHMATEILNSLPVNNVPPNTFFHINPHSLPVQPHAPSTAAETAHAANREVAPTG